MSNSSYGELAGRVAIVTGSGQGLGKAHAIRLASEGVKVVVNDIGADLSGEGTDTGLADQVVAEIKAAGGEAVANTDSVASMNGAARIIQTALDTFGRLDILINNAGNVRFRRIYETAEEDFDSVISVHLKGTFATIRAASPHFVAQRSGVIVNTGSEVGVGQYGNALYAAAKEGIAGLTRSIARDLGPHNVRANLIRPAAMSRMAAGTPLMAEITEEAELVHGFPSVAHYWITRSKGTEFDDMAPERIADFATWLCTESAAHLNGEDFRVMGGEIARMCLPTPVATAYREQQWDFASLSSSIRAGVLHKDLMNRWVGRCAE